MKILFCSPVRLDRSLGAPKVVIEFAEGLRQLGCECDLVGPMEVAGITDGRRESERYIHSLRDYLKKHAAEYDVADYDHEWLPFSRSEFPGTTLMVARSVLLHYHFAELPIPRPRNFSARAMRLAKHILTTGQRRASRRRADRTGHEADMFTTMNTYDRQTLVRHGYPREKIAVVGVGLTPERFVELSRASLEPPASPRIAFVGTFDYRKGCLDMPGIVDRVVRAIPSARFRLVGTSGLFQTAEQVFNHFPQNLRSHIEVWPRFDPKDLPELLAPCSAGIFPSYIEGFGFGVLEMLAAGLPVFAYDAPGPPDMLSGHYLVKPGDVETMANRLIELHQDPQRLTDARHAARARASEFTWEGCARQMLAAYQAGRDSLLRRNAAPAGRIELPADSRRIQAIAAE
jgi:glycosyltransferase involved in cell wall biosynthesis